ncbi:hypothetical protein V8E53_004206 [Lactarius tabidus]
MPLPLHDTERVSIVDQGNIALDVARMLLTSRRRHGISNNSSKSWSLDFFHSPMALALVPSGRRNELTLTPAHTALDVSAHIVPTGATSVLHTDLTISSTSLPEPRMRPTVATIGILRLTTWARRPSSPVEKNLVLPPSLDTAPFPALYQVARTIVRHILQLTFILRYS